MRFEVPSGDLAALLSSVRRVSDDVRSAREDKGEAGFLSLSEIKDRNGGWGAEYPAGGGDPEVSTELAHHAGFTFCCFSCILVNSAL